MTENLKSDSFNKLNEKIDNIQANPIQQKNILNLKEVATYTGLSKSTLYRLTSTGGIPCYKPNGKILYFKREEVEKWMLSNRKTTSAEIEAQAINYIVTGKSGGV